MTTYKASIIADSVNEYGDRLTTMEVTFPRFILSEVNTHRAFSRNSASSRARSLTKTIDEVDDSPFIPDYWGAHQRGMSADREISDELVEAAKEVWLSAKDNAVRSARALESLDLHKQLVNRILEPFMWHTTLISSVEWNNFFDLRIHPDAQPEIQRTAQEMKYALQHSVPNVVSDGGWHLPYLTELEIRELPVDHAKAVSAARCARVSYLTQSSEGNDLKKDLALYKRLKTSSHWSPMEHVAKAGFDGSGNYGVGWVQLRHVEDGSWH